VLLLANEGEMISEIVGVEERLAMETWRDVQNRPESDSDSDLSDLVPKVSRLLGWLSEATTIERMGLRTAVLLYCTRPDLLETSSLEQMSATSRQNVSKLVVSFRATFNLRPAINQIAKRRI
jgi:hypothetical protein